MALPGSYTSYDKYFGDVVEFLNKYQFLYNFPNTDVLVNDILNKIPEDWINFYEKKDNFSFAGRLFSEYNRLIPYFEFKHRFKDLKLDKSPKYELPKYLSLKKNHEIHNFSEIIGELCCTNRVSLVIDLGCGLGYLSQLLYGKYNIKVLGLECNFDRVNKAILRQKQSYKSSVGNVNYVQHFITKSSAAQILEYIKSMFPEEDGFYIIGLHACADLTIDAMKLFLDLDGCKGLAIMPCCYHRMEIKDSNNSFQSLFVNIPISNSLKSVWNKNNAGTFLRQPFLRLCCQRAVWKENEQNIDFRAYHLLSRAVLQLYAFKGDLRVTRKKRHVTRKKKSKKCDFSYFLDSVADGYIFQKNENSIEIKNEKIVDDNFVHIVGAIGTESVTEDIVKPEVEDRFSNGKCTKSNYSISTTENLDLQKIREDISILWNNLSKRDFKAASVLIEVQDSFQILGENLILLDKLAYLEEQQSSLNIRLNFKFDKITDESISPRCFCLLAEKL